MGNEGSSDHGGNDRDSDSCTRGSSFGDYNGGGSYSQGGGGGVNTGVNTGVAHAAPVWNGDTNDITGGRSLTVNADRNGTVASVSSGVADGIQAGFLQVQLVEPFTEEQRALLLEH